MIRKSKKMNLDVQRIIVLALFIGIVAVIAYPVVTGRNAFTAIAPQQAPYKVDHTDQQKEPLDSQEPQISPPIFQQNKN